MWSLWVGRAGFDISLDDFDKIGRTVPVIANIRPNGNGVFDGRLLLRWRHQSDAEAD